MFIKEFPMSVLYHKTNNFSEKNELIHAVRNGNFDYLNQPYIDANLDSLEYSLSLEQKKILKELNEKGYAVSHLSKLFDFSPLIHLVDVFNQYIENPIGCRGIGTRDWMKYAIYNYDFFDRLTNDFILSDSIIDPVRCYMNQLPRFIGCNFIRHMRDVSNMPHHHQLWHRDYHDVKGVKILVYLNDVTCENGAFQYVPESHGKGRFGAELYSIGEKRHISPQEMPDYLEGISIEGKKGTVIFADTYGFHCGGRCSIAHRDVIIMGFASNLSFSGDFKGEIDGSSLVHIEDSKLNILRGL